MSGNHPRLIKNNFDLIRLVLAGIVLLVHTYQLSTFKALKPFTNILSSALAVQGFFIVSGFLIFMSYDRSSSLKSYAIKRFRRIYPAYFTVIVLSAVTLFFISTQTFPDYFSSVWAKFIITNLSFLNFMQPGLPGVFETNKFTAINGALWTLKIEVMFYLSVPIFVWLFRRYSTLKTLTLTYCLSVAYSSMMLILAERTGSTTYIELARQLPGQLSYFMAGAFFYYFLTFFEQHISYFVSGTLIVLLVNLFYPVPLLMPFAIATIIIFFALYFYVGNVGKHGDYSYGIYILHFPVIQTLLTLGVLKESPWLFLLTVSSITTFGAIAMWHLVEKRFLLKHSHYIHK